MMIRNVIAADENLFSQGVRREVWLLPNKRRATQAAWICIAVLRSELFSHLTSLHRAYIQIVNDARCALSGIENGCADSNQIITRGSLYGKNYIS